MADARETPLERRADIALVTMPFGPAHQPSLGLSLLRKSVAPGRASIFYETLRFASLIGFDRYLRIANGLPTVHLVGEWVFAEAAFGRDEARDDAYLAAFFGERSAGRSRPGGDLTATERLRTDLRECRSAANSYIDEALERVIATEPLIVGFTSVFQQHVASLALARRIKDARPDTTIVMGGANCEAVMGRAVLRNFPYVDVVVSGEGELPFRDLVDRVTRGESAAGTAGVSTRRDLDPLAVRSGDRPAVIEMDDLPIPDYSDFFEEWAAIDVPTHRPPVLLFESARGCWWGAIRHCTFCGLNGERMSFRSKSPARALDELRELTTKHPKLAVHAVDNIIDREYFSTFLPQLAASPCGARIFYEVKANLSKADVRLLKDAGVYEIQPGIESLSDTSLRIMRKGITAIENVQLLKWCAEVGIRCNWNILWGFPGEPDDAYADMAELIPRLSHLQPPTSAGKIRLDRFSPNFDQAAEFGFRDVRPVPAYELVYGLDRETVADIAYFFSFDDPDAQRIVAATAGLRRAVARWREVHSTSDMWWVDDGETLSVWDMRSGAAPTTTSLTGIERALYLASDSCCSAAELATHMRRAGFGAMTAEAVVDSLAPLVTEGLMMSDGRRYLALAVALGDRRIPPKFVAAMARGLTNAPASVATAGAMS